MRKTSSKLLVFIVGMLSILSFEVVVVAQTLSLRWSLPQQLNDACCGVLPVPVADAWGRLHVFWVQSEGRGGQSVIMYRREQSGYWEAASDIMLGMSGYSISQMDATADKEGYLHLVWIDGPPVGRLFYSNAWASEAGNARAWSQPQILADRAFGCSIRVDSTGLIHVVYNSFEPGEGARHIVSEDGLVWSEPHITDTSLEASRTGGYALLAIGPDDVLHITWNSVEWPGGFPPHSVYYQRSTDGGRTWSTPYDPDPLPLEVYQDTKSAFKNTASAVAVGLHGDVHLTWHRYTGYRQHRWSADGGQTWSAIEPVFPEMGAAYNGLVDMGFDSLGHMHVVATRGDVWYQQWTKDLGWRPPQLVDATRADWHHQRVVVARGNRLYLFYGDVNETGIVWFVSALLEAPTTAIAPLPRLVSTPEAPSVEGPVSSEVVARPTPEINLRAPEALIEGDVPRAPMSANRVILLSLMPVGGLIAIAFIATQMRRRR